jgi:hypothetical protein
MTARADKKAKLLAKRTGAAATKTVVVNGVDVTVRALTRAEVLEAQKHHDGSDVATIEAAMLSVALVDPVMTVDEVRQWQEVSPAGELEPVTDALSELSKINVGAAKETYKSTRGRS